MPRAIALFLPFAVAAVGLRRLEEKGEELRWRRFIRQTLTEIALRGGDAPPVATGLPELAWESAGEVDRRDIFTVLAFHTPAQLVVSVSGRPGSRYQDRRMTGCLERATGEIHVQRTFDEGPVPLCGQPPATSLTRAPVPAGERLGG
jgi:hypothetical protein